MPTRFGKLYTKKLYLPNGKLKAQSNKMTRITASADELNKLDGLTATQAELNLNDNVWASITTATTPAAGSCAIALVFKDAAGVTMATPVAGTFYISDLATGLEVDVLDTGAAASVGALTIVDTGITAYYNFITTAAGLLTVTITSGADSHWLCFVHPTGKLVISGECVINA